MISTFLVSVGEIFQRLYVYLESLDNELHIIDIVLGIFLIYSVSRFFILPLLKPSARGSDSAKKSKKERKSDG